MPHLDHTAFVNSRRDERSLGHHTLRAYWKISKLSSQTVQGSCTVLSFLTSRLEVFSRHKLPNRALPWRDATIFSKVCLT